MSGSNGNLRFPLLDGVRALAVLAVVGVHLSDSTGFSERPLIGALTARLNLGVAIFFVLSGFLLMRPFLAAAAAGRPRPQLGPYLYRRLLRIAPAYWFALLICAQVGLITLDGGLLRYLLLLQTFDRFTVFGGIVPAWTLAVEVQFYLALPLLALIITTGLQRGGRYTPLRRALTVLLLTAAAGLILRAVVVSQTATSLWLVQAPTHLAWFAGGMLLALLSVAIEQRRPWALRAQRSLDRPTILFAAALIVYLLVSFALRLPQTLLAETTASQNMLQHIGFMLVAMLVVLPPVLVVHRPPDTITNISLFERILGNYVVRWLGLISYGIFLWHHQLLIWFIGPDVRLLERVPLLPFAALTVITLAASIIAAAISYYLIERPFLRLKLKAERPVARPASAD